MVVWSIIGMLRQLDHTIYHLSYLHCSETMKILKM
jgi:hypothetical protein